MSDVNASHMVLQPVPDAAAVTNQISAVTASPPSVRCGQTPSVCPWTCTSTSGN